MTEFFVTLGLGIMIGFVICTGVKVQPVLNACEAELPRNQACVLTAVPGPVVGPKP